MTAAGLSTSEAVAHIHPPLVKPMSVARVASFPHAPPQLSIEVRIFGGFLSTARGAPPWPEAHTLRF